VGGSHCGWGGVGVVSVLHRQCLAGEHVEDFRRVLWLSIVGRCNGDHAHGPSSGDFVLLYNLKWSRVFDLFCGLLLAS